jgi:type II secretory pathway pseudopilin PulG
MAATKSSGLALASLILGIIGFCVPITAPVALILGIIAIVKIKDSKGAVGGQGLAIAGLVTGGLGCLMIPILAAIAIPNFIRYQNRAKQSEAKIALKMLDSGAELYRSGNDEYPKGETGWVPATPCGERCAPNAGLWSASPWSELGFSMSTGHYYQYRYSSDGSSFVAEAQADLDGNGTYGGVRVTSGGAIEEINPGEL